MIHWSRGAEPCDRLPLVPGGLHRPDLSDVLKIRCVMCVWKWATAITGWWFRTFFIFHNIWDNPSHWLIFFKMVKTTNQMTILMIHHGIWETRAAATPPFFPTRTSSLLHVCCIRNSETTHLFSQWQVDIYRLSITQILTRDSIYFYRFDKFSCVMWNQDQ